MSRIAVISVHGVGHHQPREAARACADMLALTGRYVPFVESPLRVPVDPVPGDLAARTSRAAHDAQAPMLTGFEERPEFIQDPAKPAQHSDPSVEYMTEQLSRYVPEGEDCVYETVSLRSFRDDGREVHVYDMYWTDLSRVDTSGLRMIGELYQLMFYVSGLGRHTLDFAATLYRDRTWRALAWCQRWAERLLVLWIPVLNLCAATLAIIVPLQLVLAAIGSPMPVVYVIVMLFALAAWGALRILRPGATWPWTFTVVSVSSAAIAALSLWADPGAQVAAALMLAWLAAASLVVALMYVYDKRRPGAMLVTLACVAAIALLIVIGVGRNYDTFGAGRLVDVGLWTGRHVYRALWWVWTAFLGFAFLVTAIGFVQWMRFPQELDRRTVWTANLSLAVPGLFVLIFNLGLWEGVLKSTRQWLEPGTANRIQALLDDGTPYTLGLVMGVGIVAAVSIVWAIAPSLLGEIKARLVAQRGDSKECGESLSEAFHWMRYCGEGARWSLAVIIPGSVLLVMWAHWPGAATVKTQLGFSEEMTLWVGLAVIAMVAGPLKSAAVGLRTGIDVAIDVANWLRLHPVTENPRAKIAARFTSLLSNILDYRGDDGKGFERVIFFCHSQGTVIASETLRYLNLTGHGLSARIGAGGVPVTLFTMGCPLHQLYSQRFPIQYEWARNEIRRAPPPRPDPAELNVERWVNAYRSGDYVGRFLWWPSGTPGIWDRGATYSTPMGNAQDLCIGAGAHTHYWDDSAGQVARTLDGLV